MLPSTQKNGELAIGYTNLGKLFAGFTPPTGNYVSFCGLAALYSRAMEIAAISEQTRSAGWTDEEIVERVKSRDTALYGEFQHLCLLCFAVTADLAAFPAGKARKQCTYIVMR